jgi:hypothetical protein
MRGLTSTIILVLVLAGLGAYIYFVESERPAGGVEERQKVFTVDSDKISELTVTSAGETTTLRKENGTWKITSPITADADASEVSALTSAIAALEINRVVEESASNLGEYGLADPRIKVSFKTEDGAGGELHFGEKTPTQSDLYALKPGENRVFLVQAYQESSLAKKTFDLRDKRVLHFDRDKVDLVELTAPGAPPVQLARSGSEWVVKSPVQARADYGAIEGLITRLSTASMSELVDPASPDTFGLDTPAAVVSVGAGSTRATLEISPERDGAVYARDRARQMIFKVEPSLLTDVKKPADEFRDKDLFEFRTYNALRVRVTRGAETYEFQKVSGGDSAAEKWQRVTNGTATDVDTTKLEDFLSKVSALRAQSFNPTTNAAGNASADMVVAASFDDGKFERVRFIRGEKQVFGVRDGEAGVAVIDESAYEETVKALDAVFGS